LIGCPLQRRIGVYSSDVTSFFVPTGVDSSSGNSRALMAGTSTDGAANSRRRPVAAAVGGCPTTRGKHVQLPAKSIEPRRQMAAGLKTADHLGAAGSQQRITATMRWV
jgi:hypothetical protein